MRALTVNKSMTNREDLSRKYFSEISKIPMISQEEEVELAQRIKQGDMEAVQELTRANLRFVISVAKQYQNKGLPLPELINAGNIGLIRATEKFDATRGFKFISYAVWWIRQQIQAALDEEGIIYLPVNQIHTRNKILKAS
ncbi:MAG: sigma-70 family RNA polymerase sigma factor [Candidatus Peribacteria bacterium]|nr:sigma-70 family RNA polymerase sigma factor [Candidatus Peribacteria bacterium]